MPEDNDPALPKGNENTEVSEEMVGKANDLKMQAIEAQNQGEDQSE